MVGYPAVLEMAGIHCDASEKTGRGEGVSLDIGVVLDSDVGMGLGYGGVHSRVGDGRDALHK